MRALSIDARASSIGDALVACVQVMGFKFSLNPPFIFAPKSPLGPLYPEESLDTSPDVNERLNVSRQAVRRYPHPTYPTRLEVASKPGLLQKHQPPNWRRWPEIGSALGLFLAADAARVAEAADAPLSGGNQKQAVATVAPVFEHGAGRGATGCIVMNPPVFLSEEQALQGIREEMAKSRIELEPARAAIQGVGGANPFGDRKVGFQPDFVDSQAKVAVEFISEQEHVVRHRKAGA